MKKITFAILAVIVICVAITFVIVITNSVKTSAKVETEVAENIVYDNAYIIDAKAGEINFVWNNEEYKVEGTLEKEVIGICDIEVTNGTINKIRYKSDYVEGKLLSYDEQASKIQIEGYGYVSTMMAIPIYSTIENSIEEIEWDELIMGGTKLKYVLEEDKVCAAILEEKMEHSNIRVLLKNGDDVFYENAFIKSDSAGQILDEITGEGVPVEAGAVLDISSIGIEEGQSKTIIYDNGCFVFGINGTDYRDNLYEGSLVVRKTASGYVLVNVLPLETYVKYVLPSEMMLSFETEALKAQAICARTYAISQMKNMEYAKYGANLDDTTAYQVYNASGRFEKTDLACDETEGMIVTYDNEPCVCYYFSTCGDMTENFEVWESETPGYIHKVESADTDSAFYRWSSKLDVGTISDSKLGKLQSISIDKTSDCGFVLELNAQFENGSSTIRNENEIRKFLGQALISTTLNNGTVRDNFSMVPSACFNIVSCDGTSYTIEGSGFGHQIGMSQYGANRMAQNGSSCNDIICYYYNNVEIKQIGEIE